MLSPLEESETSSHSSTRGRSASSRGGGQSGKGPGGRTREQLYNDASKLGIELKTDQIDPAGIEQRRGAVEHYYRAKAKPEVNDEEWQKLPASARRQIASISLNFLVAESLASLGHGKMEADDDLAIICSQMRLDKDGRARLGAILAEAQERIEELREEEDPEAPMRFVALMQFERCRPGRPLDP